MAYAGADSVTNHNKIILFGGYWNGNYLNDTWQYDESAHTWNQISPTGGTAPSVRSGHAMAYAGGNNIILFGGSGLNDTWEFNADSHSGASAYTWTQHNIN